MVRELEELKQLWVGTKGIDCFGDTKIIVTDRRVSIIVCGDLVAWKKINALDGIEATIKDLIKKAINNMKEEVIK